jgi:DHA1 family bicyclomycin/chloramphenicol resistance-like MFS transporter
MAGMNHVRLDAVPDDASAVTRDSHGLPQDDRSSPPMAGSTFRYACVLGLLTASGALGIDTYLPAFPDIARGYGVGEDRVQLSLVSYFVALAAGQMIYGPVSDRVGRRLPLLAGFALFVVASFAAAVATSIEMLIVVRFVQGLGACAGMVIPRAIVRDLRSGEEAARLFALMLLVLGVSPILAPLLGSLLLAYLPWQAAFWFLGGFGLCCIALILFLLEETHPPDRRQGVGLVSAFMAYRGLLGDRGFLLTVLVGGCSQAVVFAYLAGSPFIYITLHAVPPAAYSLLFALNAIGLIGMAQLNVRFIRRLGATRLILMASTVQTAAAGALLAASLVHVDSVPVIASCLFFCVGAQGLVGPPTAMLALEDNAAIAGSASSLMGAIQFACGAVSGSLVSLFFNGTSVPFAAVIAGCAVSGLVCAILVRRRDCERITTVAHAPAAP